MGKSSRLEFTAELRAPRLQKLKTEPVKEQQAPKERRTSRPDRRGCRPS